MLITGPCSVESKEQIKTILISLQKQNIKPKFIRGGIWKPRTKPGHFEGYGEKALQWIAELKKEYDFQFCTEVASVKHLETIAKYPVDAVWIGARSTTSPFVVEELAQNLSSINKNIPILIKNPINPDIKLWAGAIERFKNHDINNISLIHRGFNTNRESLYRNPPCWKLVQKMQELFPNLPLYCDPSHIAGKRGNIDKIISDAKLYKITNFMIESHPSPKDALSDASQQIYIDSLSNILSTKNSEISSLETSDIILKFKENLSSIKNILSPEEIKKLIDQ